MEVAGEVAPLVIKVVGMLEEEGLRLGGFGSEDEGFGEPAPGDVPAGDAPADAADGEAPGLGRVLPTGIEGKGPVGGTLREGLEGRGKDAMAVEVWGRAD